MVRKSSNTEIAFDKLFLEYQLATTKQNKYKLGTSNLPNYLSHNPDKKIVKNENVLACSLK